VKSAHEDALPLIMTHGWPGSVIEMLETIGPLTDPTAHGGSAEDAFHLVLPSLPGYGFSAEPADLGWDLGRTATTATSPRAATSAPASPTPWAGRHPTVCSASTPTCS
jgi:pimeloyl-ACP methyl ester carboxylesterase